MQAQTRQGGNQSAVPTLIMLAVALPLMVMNSWLLSAGLILGCGLFVAHEFALVKVPVRQLEREVARGVPGANTLLHMKRDMNAMLAACQFGITLTSLGLTLALEPAIHHALEHYEDLRTYSVGLAMFSGAFLHVTFGELVPKGLSLVVPRKVLYATAPFMRLFRVLAIPFIKTCNGIANVAVRSLTGKNPDTDAHHEEGMEIGEALLFAHASGQIKPEQLRVMRNVLAFASRTAREVMTPAAEVVALDLQESWAENRRRCEENRYSRYPVIDGDLQHVIGYVRMVDVLGAELHGEQDMRPLVLPLDRRPETVRLSQVELFQGSPMIALYDEYDTFVGLVTAEDLVEQIVGEIYDETDERDAAAVETLADGAYRFDGGVLLEEAAQVLDQEDMVRHQDVDTIGGLVMKKLGRQPKPNDVVCIGPYRAVVESATGFRIRKLRVERIGAAVPDVPRTGHTGA